MIPTGRNDLIVSWQEGNARDGMFVPSKSGEILVVIRDVPQLYKQIVRTRRCIQSLSPHDHSVVVVHKTLTQNLPRRIKLTIRTAFVQLFDVLSNSPESQSQIFTVASTEADAITEYRG